MKFNIFLFLALFLLTNNGTFAYTPIPEDSFYRLNECVQNRDSRGCKDLVTASSASLYQRFISYGLMNCLPKDAQYVSQQRVGRGIVIRASVTDRDKQRFMRLMFVEEEDEWKLDVPESLRIAMGKNWQQQLGLVESIYLSMRGQFSKKIDCNMMQDLVRK